MFRMLLAGIRGLGGFAINELRQESDERGYFRRGYSGWCRADLPILFLIFVLLNAPVARAETTAIVASGLWNWETFTPSCNYTELGTFNLTYANGAYAATLYVSNIRDSNCQNIGSDSCARTGYPLAQEMLTASQFQALINSFLASCGDSTSYQSISFTSTDSISGTGIASDGRSISLQASRDSSAATSYALTVSNAGTGYGSVASSPGGISCYVPEPNSYYLVAPDCSESYATGASVTLTATPEPGSYFAGWSGDCSGTGSCVVSMNKAKSVTATFKSASFVAIASTSTTLTVVGTITKLDVSISFNESDVGKQGEVFVTAWVPVNGLDTLGISTVTSSTLNVSSAKKNPYLTRNVPVTIAPLATTDADSFVLVQLTSSGWQLVLNGQLFPKVAGLIGTLLSVQTLLNNTNITNLIGSQFCVGYGASSEEMIAAGRMVPVASITTQGSISSTATGVCIIEETVIEFYNGNLDHYFITADSNEAAAIDSGSAGPGWSRTGNSFKSGGSTSVCRFYGSQSPGPNSHFYTLAGAECDGLRQLQATTPATQKRWNFESLDFASTPATNGVCPNGTVPVYRAYNNGFARGVDSNHRITSSLSAIQEVVSRGWSNEGVVMCAPS